MGTIVQKFGGSSVADLAALERVAGQVAERKRSGDDLVVVVSAMGSTTDELMAMARGIGPRPNRRELDMLLTAGERISMALLSMAIHEQGLDAVSFTGSQSGIITEDAHGGARILEVRPTRIEEQLAKGRVVIVAGYQGVSLKREVTTLGRGGSDTTAVALAEALRASACEIYSDVDGVYSADPRVCPEARLLGALHYDTTLALALSGAQVLNPDAVAIARRAGIRIHARKTGDRSGRETVVGPLPQNEREGGPHEVLAVVGAKDVCWVCGPTAAWEEGAPVLALGGRVIAHRETGGEFVAVVGCADVTDRDALFAWAREARVLAEAGAALTVVTSRGQVTRDEAGTQWDDALWGGACAAPAQWVAAPHRITMRVEHERLDEQVRALHNRLIVRAGLDG